MINSCSIHIFEEEGNPRDILHSTAVDINETVDELFPPNQEKYMENKKPEEVEKLLIEISDLKRENENKNSTIAAKGNEINLMTVQLARLNMEKKEDRQKLEKANEALNIKTKECEKIAAENASLRSKSVELEEDLEKYAAAIQGMQKELRDLKFKEEAFFDGELLFKNF